MQLSHLKFIIEFDDLPTFGPDLLVAERWPCQDEVDHHELFW